MGDTSLTERRTLDWRTTDWPRVARAVYRVRQHYRYTYTGPIWDLKQRLVMVPPDAHGDQRLVAHELDVRGVDGTTTVRWEPDEVGNRICHVQAERVPHAVDFEVRYVVARAEHRRARATCPLPGRRTLEEYLRPTALTAPDDRLREAAREIADRETSAEGRAERAHDWAARAIGYEFGVTGVQTPAAMALHLGRGVCQDYAHIMLAVLRLAGVPGRYVSGHLLGEGAPHAWVDVLLEDPRAAGGVRVIAYDPTHHRRTGLNYITVAIGRDFADVTPTSGWFSGPAAGKLSASKQADILELEYVDGSTSRMEDEAAA